MKYILMKRIILKENNKKLVRLKWMKYRSIILEKYLKEQALIIRKFIRKQLNNRMIKNKYEKIETILRKRILIKGNGETKILNLRYSLMKYRNIIKKIILNENATTIKTFIREFSIKSKRNIHKNINIERISEILKNRILLNNNSQIQLKYSLMKYRNIIKKIMLNENATIIKTFIREVLIKLQNSKKQIKLRNLLKNIISKIEININTIRYNFAKYRRIIRYLLVNEKSLIIQKFISESRKKIIIKKRNETIKKFLRNRIKIKENNLIKKKYYLSKYHTIIKTVALIHNANMIKRYIIFCKEMKFQKQKYDKIKQLLMKRIYLSQNRETILKFHLGKYRRRVKYMFLLEQSAIIQKFIRFFMKKVEVKIIEEEEDEKKEGVTTSTRKSRRQTSSENAKKLISSSTTYEENLIKGQLMKKDDIKESVSRRRKKIMENK